MITVWRTIKIDIQAGELTLPSVFSQEKQPQKADTSGAWNLILVNREHYIPDDYEVELTELSNGKKWIQEFIQNCSRCLMPQGRKDCHCL